MSFPKAGFRSMLLAVLAIGTLGVSAQDWKKLGSKTVDLKLDQDTLVVTRRSGYPIKLKLSVSGASVFFRRIVVTYGNGEKHPFNTPVTVEKGKSTPELDLIGTQRYIEKIDLWYESRSLNGKRAKVTLYGMPAP